MLCKTLQLLEAGIVDAAPFQRFCQAGNPLCDQIQFVNLVLIAEYFRDRQRGVGGRYGVKRLRHRPEAIKIIRIVKLVQYLIMVQHHKKLLLAAPVPDFINLSTIRLLVVIIAAIIAVIAQRDHLPLCAIYLNQFIAGH